MNPVQVQIDLSKTKANFCHVCKGEEFDIFYYIRTVSAIYSPTGRPEIIYVPAYRCSHCKNPFSETPPKQADKPDFIR